MSNQQAHLVLDALGDHHRRRIVELLADGPRPVGVLADQLPIGRPAVSKHLKVLQGAGLVTHESRGTRNLYALAPDGLAPIQVWLATTWDRRLASFQAHVATHQSGDPDEPDH